MRLHKRVRCAARGLGLEISVAEQRANAKAPEVWINDDMLLKVCHVPKKSNSNWSVVDPSLKQGTQAEQLIAYRQTRDDIRQQLGDWLDALGITGVIAWAHQNECNMLNVDLRVEVNRVL